LAPRTWQLSNLDSDLKGNFTLTTSYLQLSCIYFLFFSYIINWQTRPDKRNSQLVAAVVDQKALQISAKAGKLEPLLKEFGQQQGIMS